MFGNDEQSDLGPDLPEADAAPAGLRKAFWKLVLLMKVALISTTIGALVLVFENDVEIGVGLLSLGIGTFGVWIRRYRQVRARLRTDAGFEDATSQ